MFRREYQKRRSFLPFVIFRLCLSLVMLLILGLGAYQAFRYFSGLDPLRLDPKNLIVSVVSQDFSKVAKGFWGLNLAKNISVQTEDNKVDPKTPEGDIILKFAIVADSHNDNDNLGKALNLAKSKGVKFVIGLGDWTETGQLDQLEKAKAIFQSSGLPYYVTAGDHDLWDARNKSLVPTANFSDVFGSSYQSFGDSNIRFVILYNSDNYVGVDPLQMQWLEELLMDPAMGHAKDIFVFLHEPLYHPSSDHMMGSPRKTGEAGNEREELKKQAEKITGLLKQAKVSEVFAGDIHAYSWYEDPKTGLKMTTVGALTRERNAEKSSFVIVDVYDSGSYNITNIEI